VLAIITVGAVVSDAGWIVDVVVVVMPSLPMNPVAGIILGWG